MHAPSTPDIISRRSTTGRHQTLSGLEDITVTEASRGTTPGAEVSRHKIVIRDS